MKLRGVVKEDLPEIISFHKENSNHELDFSSILYHGVIEENGKIIAYGAVKDFREMVISLNKSSNRDKSKAIEELFGACVHLAKLHGVTNLYAFAENEFANLLKKHFGFSEINRRILGTRIQNGQA